AIGDLAQDALRDRLLARLELEPAEERVGGGERQAGQLGQALVADADPARLLAQARAPALFARGLVHVAVEFLVDGLERFLDGRALLAAAPLVLGQASLQVGDD